MERSIQLKWKTSWTELLRLVRPWMEVMETWGWGGSGVSVSAEKRETHEHSSLPHTPPHTIPDILPPCLPLSLALSPFSETDRTREACESKDERPASERGV